MSSSRSFLRSHHSENCEMATKYDFRVFLLRMLAVKNPQNRLPALWERKKIVGRLPAEPPTAASWRPEMGIRLLSRGMVQKYSTNWTAPLPAPPQSGIQAES